VKTILKLSFVDCVSVNIAFGLTQAGAASLKMGDPADPETFIGPMITENDAIRLEKWVGEATKHGAKVLVGGKREGNFFTPTVLEDVHNGADIHCQEAFGYIYW
jgi:acyl-CoA reductase-like NAD-dependent aldehyde dehydrogenase